MPNSAPHPSQSRFAAAAREARDLHAALVELEQTAAELHLPPLASRDWFELLTRKLLPQLTDAPYLVVAVVGGTNIGKSVIFNHLAQCQASSVSPLASGTRHPVCLVPLRFDDEHDLAELFAEFELHPWTDPAAALEPHDEHRLYWQANSALPDNLLVLDTPDIDSDAPVNWLRADRIRHSADLLIAVLTQQKYNDAAVKRFFRCAAAEDKAVIIVFNQCLLPEDEAYWPLWLDTFMRETGVAPMQVYVVPNDRRAAVENRLPFYWRALPTAVTAASAAPRAISGEPHDLHRDLAALHFEEIKLRTLRGAVRQVLSPVAGAPALIAEIREKSAAFQKAAAALTLPNLSPVQWPTPPGSMIVAAVRDWWRGQRLGMTRTIHDFYGTVGKGVLWPFQWARRQLTSPPPEPRIAYRRQEWEVLLTTVDSLFAELQRLSEVGNDLLRPRLERLLAGQARVQLMDALHTAHDQCDFDLELTEVVAQEMVRFRTESPLYFRWLHRLDSAAAAARPLTSMGVFFAFAGPVGHVFTNAAAHSVIHIVSDLAGGASAVVAGETVVTSCTDWLRYVEIRFRQLQAALTARRVDWFTSFLRDHLLGDLLAELQHVGQIPQSAAMRQVESSLASLAHQWHLAESPSRPALDRPAC